MVYCIRPGLKIENILLRIRYARQASFASLSIVYFQMENWKFEFQGAKPTKLLKF